MCIQNMYKLYKKYNKILSCNCQQNRYKIVIMYTNHVQNTYKIQPGGGGFPRAKPPPPTTQNGMFFPYDRYKT